MMIMAKKARKQASETRITMVSLRTKQKTKYLKKKKEEFTSTEYIHGYIVCTLYP